jgi:hypothetical protein
MSADELDGFFGPELERVIRLRDECRLSQFSLEGYWTLLLGQQVPYQNPYVPGSQEREVWWQIPGGLQGQGDRGGAVAAEGGVSVRSRLRIRRL